MKRFFCLIAGVMILSIGSVSMAAEDGVVSGNVNEVIIERAEDEIYPVVDEQPITDGRTRASWGEGILHSSNPLGANPSAYAETKTYSGTAYCMYAQTGLVDDDGISYLTDKQQAYSISTISSATLLSPTSHCDFIGYHGIKDTSSSGWQTSTTHVSY